MFLMLTEKLSNKHTCWQSVCNRWGICTNHLTELLCSVLEMTSSSLCFPLCLLWPGVDLKLCVCAERSKSWKMTQSVQVNTKLPGKKQDFLFDIFPSYCCNKSDNMFQPASSRFVEFTTLRQFTWYHNAVNHRNKIYLKSFDMSV